MEILLQSHLIENSLVSQFSVTSVRKKSLVPWLIEKSLVPQLIEDDV